MAVMRWLLNITHCHNTVQCAFLMLSGHPSCFQKHGVVQWLAFALIHYLMGMSWNLLQCLFSVCWCIHMGEVCVCVREKDCRHLCRHWMWLYIYVLVVWSYVWREQLSGRAFDHKPRGPKFKFPSCILPVKCMLNDHFIIWFQQTLHTKEVDSEYSLRTYDTHVCN